MRRLRTLLLVSMVAVSAAGGEERELAATPKTYLVTKLVPARKVWLRSVLLRNDTTGGTLELEYESDEPIVVECSPGAYYVLRVRTEYTNLRSVVMPKPEALLVLVPGTLNYIGDLAIGLDRALTIDFAADAETLQQVRKQHGALLAETPLALIGAGVAPAPIRFDAEEPSP